MPANPTRLTPFVLIVLLAAAGPSQAQFIWTGAADPGPDGVFGDPLNWNFAVVPSAGDTAVFDLNDTYTVTFDSSPVNDTVSVSNGDVTFTEAAGPDRTYFIQDLSMQFGALLRVDDLDVNAAGAIGTFGLGGELEIVGDSTVTANSGFFVGSDINGPGLVTVDGASGTALLSAFGDSGLGGGPGNTGELRVVNGGAATFNILGVNDELKIGIITQGVIDVGAGSLVQVEGQVDVADQGLATGDGRITVSGAGAQFNQIGNHTLNIGATQDSTALVEVNSGGQFTTSLGATNVDATGSVNLDDGTFTAQGDLSVTSGRIDLANNATLNAQGQLLYANNDLNVLGGSSVTVGNEMLLIAGSSSADLRVDGVGSQVAVSEELTVEGTGIDTTASVTVTGGGSVGAADVGVAPVAGPAKIDLSGAGSSLTADRLVVGGAYVDDELFQSAGDGALNIGFGSLAIANNELLVLGASNLNLNGGELRAPDLGVYGEAGFNFNAGLLRVTQDADFTTFNAAPLQLGRTVQVDGQTTFLTPFTIDGGRFETETLVGGVLVQLNSGTLAVTGAGGLAIDGAGPLGPIVSIPTAAKLEVTNSLTVGAAGLAQVSGGTLEAGTINNQGQIVLGGVTSQVNATSLNNSGLLNGVGRVDAVVSNTGRIEALDQSGEQTFVGAVTNQASGLIAVRNSSVRFFAGLDNQGQLSLSDGPSDLLGDVDNTGTIGLSSQSVGSVVGDLTQNGTANLLTGSRLIVFDTFSGAGGTTGGGTLEVLGELDLGNSPAEVSFGGDLVLGGGATTTIELGGTVPGEFDRAVVAGETSLAGALGVLLIDGFTPVVGQSFEIFETGVLEGEFAGLADGDLVGDFGDANLYISYTAGDGNDVALFAATLPGDYNLDGVVDAGDYVVWRGSVGQPAGSLLNDIDGGEIGDAQYATWTANYGATLADAATSSGLSVPEPTTFVLAALAVIDPVSRRRRQRPTCPGPPLHQLLD